MNSPTILTVPNSRWPHTQQALSLALHACGSLGEQIIDSSATGSERAVELPAEFQSELLKSAKVAHERLRKILGDDVAWLPDNVAISDAKRLVAEQAEFYSQQRKNAQDATKPHRVLGVQLVRGVGEWIAYNGQIIGRASSPIKALEAFDAEANKQISEEQAAKETALAEQAAEQAAKQVDAARKTKKKKSTNEDQH